MSDYSFSGEEHRGLLHAVFEAAVDGIVIADSEGSIITVNPAVERIFGYKADELVGKNVRMLMPPPYHGEHDSYIQNHLRTGIKKIIGIGRDVQGLRKDGSIFPMYLGVSETTTVGGRVFVGIVRDIAERLASEELRVAMEAAEKANAAKSEFLSRMSHELRTPLNAVLGFAQLLNMQYEDTRIQEATQSINKAGHHLLTLINEVLDLSRIETGKLSLSLEPVSLHLVLRQAIDLVRPQALKRSVSVSIANFDGRDIHVKADRQRLLQVFVNLLANAVNYNREHGTVSISYENDSLGFHTVVIEDTGIGIACGDMKRLFQPFERLAPDRVEGTGLGLALSKRFVEMMDGKIDLRKSTPDGSVFAVTLSRDQAADSQIAGQIKSVREWPSVRTGRILCIEDNLSNLRLIELTLEPWAQVELIPAMQGHLGLELAYNHRPDVILLDLHLPDISGIDVLQRLKANEETSGIPVVVISADATPNQRSRLIELGAYAYLTKPLDIRQFLKVMQNLLPHGGGNE